MKVIEKSKEIVYLTLPAGDYTDKYLTNRLSNPYNRDKILKSGAWEKQFRKDEQSMFDGGLAAIDNIQGSEHFKKFMSDKPYMLNITAPDPSKVTFKTGSADLNDAGKSELDKLFVIMTLIPDSEFNLEGHTDGDGSAKDNMNLSKNRANASMNYLIDKGISTERLTTTFQGESLPVLDNSTQEGKAQNRRIETTRTK